MAGKFNLLTIMTLDAAGYTAGIDDAKKSTKALVDGTGQATDAIKNSFGSIAGLSAGALGALSGVQTAIMAGTSAFKAMIPAINGVSVALISSGIGAIVVAVGVGVAALMSYLKGTSEGANKLKVAMASISGVVNTLLQRMKLLGSALVNLFSGNWDKMKEDFAAAFASGFLDEAKKNAEQAVTLAKEEIALAAKKRGLQLEEAEIKRQISVLNYNARNMDESTMEGAKEKLKDVKTEIGLTQQLFRTRKDIADTEVAMQKQQMQNKYGSGMALATAEDKQALIDKQTTRINLDSEYYDWLAGQQRLVGKLEKQINAENTADVDEQTRKLKVLQDFKTLNAELDLEQNKKELTDKKEIALNEVDIWKEKETKKIMAVKAVTADEIKLQIEAIDKVNKYAEINIAKVNKESGIDDSTTKIKNDEFYLNLKDQLYKSNYEAHLIDLKTFQDEQTQSIKKAQEDELKLLENKYLKGELMEKQYQDELKKLKAKQVNDDAINENKRKQQVQQTNNAKLSIESQTFGELASISAEAFGKQSEAYKTFAIAQASIATYLAAEKMAAATAEFGPFVEIPDVAAVIASGLMNVAKIAGFADGGIVGGSAFSGDKVHVRVNSGEMILNKAQQANLFNMANNGAGGGYPSEIRLRASGSDLVGTINNHYKKTNNTR